MKRLVTLGGGSGHAQVLKAAKGIPNLEITGICPSTDSGGSTGVLQREYNGSGYTGDLTKCILALCDDETLVRGLSYRYESGPLHTHSVKNLLFHALEQVSSTQSALQTMWKLCGLGNHRVIPVTTEQAELCASLRMGNTIVGETNIDTIAKNPLWNPEVHSIVDVYLKPDVPASEMVTDSIGTADYIVVCPGDLYSSILPVLLPSGMKEAIGHSKAPIILVLNIMTKNGETDNYSVEDFIERIEARLGRRADYILHNTAPIPDEVLVRYSLEKKVELASIIASKDPRIISCPLVLIDEAGHVVTDAHALQQELEKVLM